MWMTTPATWSEVPGPAAVQMGLGGVQAPSGFIQYRDDNRDLQLASARYGDVNTLGDFERAYLTDPSVKSAVQAIVRPISASISRSEVDPNGAAPRVADYVKWLLFDSSQESISSWGTEAVRTSLVNGFALSNHVARHDAKRQAYALAKMSPRPPWSVYRWYFDDLGDWRGIQQYVSQPDGSYRWINIPRDVLVHWRVEQQGDDPTGTPILRSVHQEIRTRAIIRRLFPVFADREALGYPTIWLQKGATKEDKQLARDAMKNLRSHEKSYLLLPEGAKMEWKTSQREGGDVLLSILRGLGELIREALGQEVRSLGTSQTGSRAVGEVLDDQFTLGIEAYGLAFTQPINDQLIPRFVDWTFGPQDRYPLLRLGAVRRQDATIAMKLLIDGVAAKVITPTPTIERRARELAMIPEEAPPVVPTPTPAAPPQMPEQMASPEVEDIAPEEVDDPTSEGIEAVHALIFEVPPYDSRTAARWAELREYISAPIEKRPNSLKVVQRPAGDFARLLPGTRLIGKGVRAVVGILAEPPEVEDAEELEDPEAVELAARKRPTPPVQRVWRATADEKTCKLCQALDGKTSHSGVWRVLGVAVDHAPAHENCRCSTEPAALSDMTTEGEQP